MKNIEKIEIKTNQYVWVDKDAEISGFENNIWVYRHGRVWLWLNTMALISNSKPIKIIAASPELNLEGVPNWTQYVANNIKPNDYYQTAEKELFTEEEVRKAIEMAQTWNEMLHELEWSEEEIIEQLKQAKK